MSWINLAVSETEAARLIMRDAVRRRQAFGMKQPEAFKDTGNAYEKTARRVRSLMRGEIFCVLRDEFYALMERRWDDLRQHAAELRARADELEEIEQKERAALVREMSCFRQQSESLPRLSCGLSDDSPVGASSGC